MFHVNKGQVSIDKEILLIPEYKKIHDKWKDKSLFVFAYIYHLVDFKALGYNNLSEVDRKVQCLKDFCPNDLFSPDDALVLAGIEKYNQLQETPSMRLYQSAFKLVDKLAEYFTDVQFNAFDEDGDSDKKATNAMKNLAALGNAVKSLKDLKDVVEQEIAQSQVRGNRFVSNRERPKK
jgi:hypothetical protein